MSIRLSRTVVAGALSIAFPAVSAAAPIQDEAVVVVTASRIATHADELLADVSVIERDAIEQAGHSTLDQLLARQPGIEFSANGGPGASSSIYIRGSESGHAIVLIDGQRVGSATLGNLSWSRIPLQQIERIEILRGPASALYGSDAIGGVVQIFTRRGKTGFRPYAEIGLGSYGARSISAGFMGGSDGWRVSLNGASSQTKGFSNIRNPANRAYNPDRDGFSNDSITANISYVPAKGHEIGVALFHSDGTNQYDTGTTAAAAARDHKNSLAVQSHAVYSKNAITDRWASTVRIGRTADDSTNYANGTVGTITRTDQDQVSWLNDVHLPIGTLLLGWEDLKQKISGTAAYTLKSRNIRSLLAGWTTEFSANRLQFNVRRDDNSQFGAHKSWALAYGYQFDPAWRATASMGTAFRAPTFNDLYYPLNFGYVGNPNLQPESARNRELAVHYETGTHRLSATWYRNDIKNLISWSGLTSPVNVGEARIDGLTFSYTGHWAGYDLAGNLDLLEARDVGTGRYLARRAQERLNLSLSRVDGPWEWRTELQSVGARFNENANTTRLGGYTVANLQARRKITGAWSVFGRVNNVFGKRYELAADFGTPEADIFIGLRYQPK